MRELIASKPAEQSVQHFCAEQHISEAKYYYWNHKLQQQEAGVSGKKATTGFIAIKSNLSHHEGQALARLDLITGTRVTVYHPVVFNLLKELL